MLQPTCVHVSRCMVASSLAVVEIHCLMCVCVSLSGVCPCNLFSISVILFFVNSFGDHRSIICFPSCLWASGANFTLSLHCLPDKITHEQIDTLVCSLYTHHGHPYMQRIHPAACVWGRFFRGQNSACDYFPTLLTI